MSDDEVTEFIIGRMAELVVVLVTEHLGSSSGDRQVRADVVAILMTLGNWAATHGRPDLMPQLHGFVRKIAKPSPSTNGICTLNGTMVKRVNFRW